MLNTIQESILNILKKVKESILNNDEFTESFDKYLMPNDIDRKNYAEIPTPYILRQTMLDKIPEEFWKSKKKVIEPCAGKGGFIIDIIKRFMNGLKDIIKDKNQRYKVIIEECIYFAEKNPLNIHLCKLLIDPDNEYSLNYYQGNTLDLDIRSVWNIEGFDAVIGNPPYENRDKKGDNHLYLDFTVFSLDILKMNGVLLFITPKLILENLLRCNINRKRIKNFYNLEYIAIDTPKQYFPLIGTNFVYFLLEKADYNGKCMIEYLDNNIECKTMMTLIEGMNMPNNLNKTILNIIKKTTNKLSNEIRPLFNSNIKRPLYLVNNKLRLQRIRKEHFDKKIISKDKTDIFTYEITNGFTRKKYQYPGQIYYIDMAMQDYQKPKVVISHSGFEVGWDESGLLNLSDALSYILGDIKIYHNFKQLLSSKLIQFLLKIYKNNTLHDLYKLITKNLLYISLDNELTDEYIYKHYAITEEEQEFIEKYI